MSDQSKKKLHRVALVSVLALLAGCKAGPNFTPPGAPGGNGYSMSGDRTLVAADQVPDAQRVAVGQQLSGDWWTLFHSPDLDAVVRQAVAGSPSLVAAKQTLVAADETTRAIAAGFLPSVNASGSVARVRSNFAQSGIALFPDQVFNLYQAGVSVNYNFDLAGGVARQVEQQAAQAESAGYQLDAAYLTLTGQVVTEALTIAALGEQIHAVNDIVADDQRNLDLVQKSKAAGTANDVDIQTAASQLANDRTQLPPLQQQLGMARHALAVLVGKVPSDWAPPDFALDHFTLPRDIPVSLPSDLVRQRPDIRAAEANLHAASAAIGVAKAAKYPSLNLVAQLAQTAFIPGNFFKEVATSGAIGPGLSGSLFNAANAPHEKAAEAAYQASVANYQETVLQSFRQVADNLEALAHDQDELAAQDKAVDAASNSLRLTRLSFQAGNTGVLQVLDSERLDDQARIGHAKAVAQRYLDTAQLFLAMGGGWWQWNGRSGELAAPAVQPAAAK